MSQFRQHLQQLPLSEQEKALSDFVYERFRHALLLEPDETVDFKQSFFDLGLTSLKLSQIRHELETNLACVIDTTVLFNHPTVPVLLKQLKRDVLPHLSAESASDCELPESNPAERDTISQLLNKKFNL